MAYKSSSVMYCVLCSTTSAIAPKAAVMSVRSVLKKSTSSAVLQIAKPSCSPRRLLARQPSITAPLKNSGDSALDRATSWKPIPRSVWQEPQWPGPSIRYCPRVKTGSSVSATKVRSGANKNCQYASGQRQFRIVNVDLGCAGTGT